ncbi:prostatic acid phosphatase-like [Maniola jurtina]|uniref:prostatic acid phosphatase-like n=1 Tax=Maniola jurtina TaxID=191418 RepID=UPI001E68BEF4|nr:prostatic acid phosphatase-like [Maniola jurtina]
MRLVIVFLLFVTLIGSLTFGEKVVKYAAIIYRHGDRTPVSVYPTDPWKNESLWPAKFGELTNIGKRQHYALGRWLRKRYTNLISEQFDPTEIYVRSTDVDRTLMSAQANLAGMYPPSGSAIWDTHLLWQPIPVHTRPEKDDEVLAMKRKCVPYDKEKAKYMHSKAYKERLSKYQGLMDYLTAYTGMKVNDYLDIEDIYNVLYIETLYNFTLPKWTHSVYPDKMKEPSCYSFVTATATPLMSRLLSGPLLKEIVGEMNTIITKKNPNPLKLSIYSGHDFTIANVLCSIGVYDGNCPVYTSTIIFELLQDNNTTGYFIRMLYRNSTGIVEPHILDIPHCGQICPIERFVKLYENLLTVDWQNECMKQSSPTIGAALFLALIIFMYVIQQIHIVRVEMRRAQFPYTSVDNPKAILETNTGH